jgi:acetyl esterase
LSNFITRLWTAREPGGLLRRVPVWMWQTLMHGVARRELAYFNVDPIADVDYATDIDYAGDGTRAHRLDVITPRATQSTGLPVYVYFHGGGWTSGDKAPLTKYCASQARAGMVVVNANYRRAPRFHMGSMLQDANAVLDWVTRNAEDYGGDPQNIVLGGDSAGGHIAALITAATHSPDLADYFDLPGVAQHTRIKGLVQHCSAVDFSVMLEPGFVLSLQFIRMLIPPKYRRVQTNRSGPDAQRRPPAHRRAATLRRAARYLSPIEWLGPRFPPVFISTSERDYFFRANLNFMAGLRRNGVAVDALVYDRKSRNAVHTWQQNFRHEESQAVYRRLQCFVSAVTRDPVPAMVTP